MPGEHLDAYIMQCWQDVGGTDFWVSSYYTPQVQWWVGWHTQNSFDDFHPSQKKDWKLIGYELWPTDGPGYMKEAYYAIPNPSTTRPAGLTPSQGHYHIIYDDHGGRTGATYSAHILTWNERDAFIKGDGNKGFGKAFRKGKQLKGHGKGKWGKGKNYRG